MPSVLQFDFTEDLVYLSSISICKPKIFKCLVIFVNANLRKQKYKSYFYWHQYIDINIFGNKIKKQARVGAIKLALLNSFLKGCPWSFKQVINVTHLRNARKKTLPDNLTAYFIEKYGTVLNYFLCLQQKI